MIKHVEQPFSFPRFAQLLFEQRRQAAVYGLSIVIISFNLCFFLQANMRTPSSEKTINVIQLCCFGIMGIVNVWFFYRKNILAGLSLTGAKLAFICLLFVIIALVLFIYYIIAGNNSLIMAFGSSSAFLLPFIVYQGWKEFMGIPEKKFSLWFLPEQASAAAPTYSAMSAIQVQFVVSRRTDDAEPHSFPVATWGKLKLGRVFEKFIEDQQVNGKQTAIQTFTAGVGPHAWQFYEKKWGGIQLRVLNPLKSMLENNLKSNAVIVIKRIAE